MIANEKFDCLTKCAEPQRPFRLRTPRCRFAFTDFEDPCAAHERGRAKGNDQVLIFTHGTGFVFL